MPKCSFCAVSYEWPRGLTYVLSEGTVLHFCSSKCRKNFELGRKNRKVKWVLKMKRSETELMEEMKEAEAQRAEEKRADAAAKEEKKPAKK